MANRDGIRKHVAHFSANERERFYNVIAERSRSSKLIASTQMMI